MGGAYPAAYRRSASPYSSGPGFQRPPGAPLPSPANQNAPAPPRPANDNFPKSPGKGSLSRSAMGGILKRFIPYLGWGLTAWELYELYKGYDAPQAVFTPPGGLVGWNQCPTCPPFQVHAYTVDFTAGCPVGCLSLQAISPVAYGSTVANNIRRVILWRWDNAAHTRYANTSAYWRNASSPFVWPGWHAPPDIGPFADPAPMPNPRVRPGPRPNGDPKTAPVEKPGMPAQRPLLPPWIDPMHIPPFMPHPLPIPPPYRAIPGIRTNPWRNPREQPRRGPRPAPRPRPRPIERHPMDRPDGQPGPTIEVTPGRPMVERNPNPQQRPARPRPGEKEGKRKVVTMVAFVRRILNTVTESADLITAIWKAIPYKDRMDYHQGKRKPTIQDRAQAIYDMFDKIDWEEALNNVIENQIEDFAFGKAGKAGGKKAGELQRDRIAPDTGRGYGSGPWDSIFSDFN